MSRRSRRRCSKVVRLAELVILVWFTNDDGGEGVEAVVEEVEGALFGYTSRAVDDGGRGVVFDVIGKEVLVDVPVVKNVQGSCIKSS